VVISFINIWFTSFSRIISMMSANRTQSKALVMSKGRYKLVYGTLEIFLLFDLQ